MKASNDSTGACCGTSGMRAAALTCSACTDRCRDRASKSSLIWKITAHFQGRGTAWPTIPSVRKPGGHKLCVCSLGATSKDI
jgi:hypothetical protein